MHAESEQGVMERKGEKGESSPPPRGGTPLYKPYRYEPPQRVWFLRRFGLKTGVDFAHFDLESGNVFIVSIPRK